jgi:hypothetical protein
VEALNSGVGAIFWEKQGLLPPTVFGIFPENRTFQTQVINSGLKIGAVFKGKIPLDYS